jgi:hypothetical protein
MTQWIVKETPIGTNLGLYDGRMTLLGGHLLASRGAIIPALSAVGLSRQAVKRTGQALAHGAWETNELLERFYQQVCEEQQWQPLVGGGYRVKALDTMGLFRPRLKGGRTVHYDSHAQRALPALGFGLLADLGQVNGQTVTLTRYVVRAQDRAGSAEGLMKRLARQTARVLSEHDVSTADRGFSPIVLLNAGHQHLVLRRPKNLTLRRADLPEYRGRKPTRGALVRPLARSHNGTRIPASPPDAELTWEQTEAGRTHSMQAQIWLRVMLPAQKGWTQSERALSARSVWTVLVIQHPDFDTPWVILLNVDLTPPQAYQVVRGRWGVEQPQPPLVAQQLLGAHRQFVYAPDMRFRLPELSLLAAGRYAWSTSQPPRRRCPPAGATVSRAARPVGSAGN